MKSWDDMIAFAREALGLAGSVSLELFPLEGRGSDRNFFRLKWNRRNSAILIHYDPGRVENTYYADIAIFLLTAGIPVPRVIRHDPANCFLMMEDLGDTDLLSFREVPWENRRVLYQKTLAVLERLHRFPEKDLPSSQLRLAEAFGDDLYLWERNYFIENFVKDYCRMEVEPGFEKELEAELYALSKRLAGTVRCLVHRDFQSQNVMIHRGEPFLIDFQGMRFGSPFYDLGSLLCDPYVDFSDGERDELLSFYYGLGSIEHGIPGRPERPALSTVEGPALSTVEGPVLSTVERPALSTVEGPVLSTVEGQVWGLDWTTFRDYFWQASAQRLMQALGAFAFLSIQKGLKSFLCHIPSGLRNLCLASSQVESLPGLRELSGKCQDSIGCRVDDRPQRI